MIHNQLDAFRALVLRDTELQQHLRASSDRRLFIERLRLLAAQRGYTVSIKQIETALAEARRAWHQRRSVR